MNRALSTLLVLALAGCTSASPPAAPSRPEPSSPPASPTPVPPPPTAPSPALVSLGDAEPLLVSIEDRRFFDVSVLNAALASADPPVRARAALAAGRIGDEKAAGLLSRTFQDPSADVRESAAFAAGILGVPALSTSLAPLLADPEDRVAARAAWSLGFLEAPEGRQALLEALKTAPASRRAPVLFALWRFPTPEVAAAAAVYAADPDDAVRRSALYALSRRPQEVSRPTLTACLRDPDTAAAALCARALGLLGGASSIDPLGAALDDRRPAVVIASLTALSAALEKDPALTAPADRAARVTSLAGNANPNLAIPALSLLRFYSEDRDAFRRMWASASGGEGRRRQVALRAAVAALPDQAGSLLDAAMVSSDPFLRGAAASALAFLPPAEASSRRAKLWADPDPIVRLKVLESLEAPPGTPGATQSAATAERVLVDAALADPVPAVRAAAVDLASEGEGGYAVLTRAIDASRDDTNPDVAITVIGAAERHPESAEARAVVEAAYRLPSTLVSRLARRSLVRTFHADPTDFPWRSYDTGKTPADYAALLEEARKGWTARIETARGTFTIRLAGADAPLTVMNLVRLARKSYFDGAPIHRVVPGFVVQDGDPTGTGSGGPGYEIRDELTPLPYATGTVGMALSGPDTGGSQWFVTQAPQPHLDGGYTVFGQIGSGMDVVLRIEQDDRIRSLTVLPGAP